MRGSQVTESERQHRRASLLLCCLASCVLGTMAFGRWHSVHQETFDLGFYARLAWGLGGFDFWEPILDAHVFGLRISPILMPLGWLGRVFGTVPVLLVAQAVAIGGAALVLGRLAARHLGPRGHLVGALALLAHPNISHVATYEWHPGTLALLPLAVALERLDARDSRGVLAGCLGILACREDLALVTALFGAALFFRARPSVRSRRIGVGLGVGSLAYLAFFTFVLHPLFAPAEGSFGLHFGHLGDSPAQAVTNLAGDPTLLWDHVDLRKITWLPRVLAPLAFLPLAAPRYALFALPALAIAFLSGFPTTDDLDSHYLTPALPALVAAAVMGAARLRAMSSAGRAAAPALVIASLLGLVIAGRAPWDPVFRPDETTRERRAMLEALERMGEELSLQVPASLLPHVAERPRVHFGWEVDRGADVVVLDIWHRERYEGREDLLRTQEEPIIRSWFARQAFGVVAREGRLVALRRGADPRGGIASDYFVADAPVGDSVRFTSCLSVGTIERLDAERVAVSLLAHGRCPADLALRLDDRVELLFDGILSPAHLRAGDRLVSVHHANGDTVEVSLLRSSGAKPEHGDPWRLPRPVVPQSTSLP